MNVIQVARVSVASVLLFAALTSVSTALLYTPLIYVSLRFAYYFCHTIWPYFRSRSVVQSPNRKAVFITGCDSGFGHLLAKRLDDLGFHVYAGCHNNESKGAQALRACGSSRLQTLPLEVTSCQSVDAAVQFVKERLGEAELMAVVNNAGTGILAETEWHSMEMFDLQLQLNTLGSIRVTRAFLPLLRKTPATRIVQVVAITGRLHKANASGYVASKAGILAFCNSLRLELKKWPVSVHTIEPEVYITPMSTRAFDLGNVRKAFEGSSEEVQQSYGQEYYDAYEEMITPWPATRKLNIEEMIADMADAAVGTKPQDRYVPGLYSRLCADLLCELPEFLQTQDLMQATPNVKPALVKQREGLSSAKHDKSNN